MDADPCEESGFNDSKAIGYYQNADRRICSFHKVDRNFVSANEYANAVKENNQDVSSEIELKLIGTWMFKFPMEYETREECDVSLRLLTEYMDLPRDQKNGELTDRLKEGAKDFIQTKFKDSGPRMFRCYFFDKPTFDNHTTGVNEGVHRGMKKSSIGPDASDSIDATQVRIGAVDNKREKDRTKQVTNDMDSKALTEIDQKRIIPHWTRKCNKDILKEFDAARRFDFMLAPPRYCREGETVYLVRLREEEEEENPQPSRKSKGPKKQGRKGKKGRKKSSRRKGSKGKTVRWTRGKAKNPPPSVETDSDDSDDEGPPPLVPVSQEEMSQSFQTRLRHRVLWFVPRFARTRRVVIKEQHGVWIADCDCKFWIRHQKCCRHIYGLLDRFPELTDATIRHWNIYHRDFLKDDVLTEKMKKIRDETPLTGVPVKLEDLAKEGRGCQDPAFYTEALNATVLRGPSYWTEVKGYKVMSDIVEDPLANPIGCGVTSETRLSELQETLNEETMNLTLDDEDSTRMDYYVQEGEEEEDASMSEVVEVAQLDPEKAMGVTKKIYQGICSDIRTPAQLERFRKLLTEHRLVLTEENAPAVAVHNPPGMASMPSVQTSQNEKRIQNFSSPHRKGEKKRRR